MGHRIFEHLSGHIDPIHLQMNQIADFDITTNFPGDGRKFVVRLIAIDHIVASDRIDGNSRLSLQINANVLRRLSKLNITVRVITHNVGIRIRIG